MWYLAQIRSGSNSNGYNNTPEWRLRPTVEWLKIWLHCSGSISSTISSIDAMAGEWLYGATAAAGIASIRLRMNWWDSSVWRLCLPAYLREHAWLGRNETAIMGVKCILLSNISIIMERLESLKRVLEVTVTEIRKCFTQVKSRFKLFTIAGCSISNINAPYTHSINRPNVFTLGS